MESSIEQTIRMNNLSRELKKYGFAQNSQEAISQAGSIYGNSELNPETEIAQLTRAQFSEIVTKMQRLWLFKENNDQKMTVIADQVVKVTDKLNEIIKSISLIEMNQAVFDKKLNVLKDKSGSTDFKESSSSVRNDKERVEESSDREKEQRKLDKPIDRNGVAPADVSIEKMFYFGKK